MAKLKSKSKRVQFYSRAHTISDQPSQSLNATIPDVGDVR